VQLSIPKATSQRYLPTLDGWRAVAIGLVLLAHTIDSARKGDAGPVWHALMQGGLGVSVFFAISGFLITNRLLREESKTGTISLKNFYQRRIFRIFPAAYTYLGVIAVLRLAGFIYVPIRHWLMCAACSGNYTNYVFNDAWTWYLGHFWSLAVEEHFYLFWPAILVFTGKKRALWIAPALALAIAAWRTTALSTGIVSIHDGSWFGRTDLVGDGLFWGCAIALFANLPAGSRILRYCGRPLVLVPAIGAVVAWTLWRPAPWLALPGQTVVALLLAVIVAATTLHPETAIGKALDGRFLRWIGRLSYSLYLWQQLFLAAGPFPSPRLHLLQSFPANLAATFLCATLSYYFIEQPFIRFGHRFLAGTPAAPPREQPAGPAWTVPVLANEPVLAREPILSDERILPNERPLPDERWKP
jgi:peptidoglycan/LPS O-acetylase OafA/YrhL